MCAWHGKHCVVYEGALKQVLDKTAREAKTYHTNCLNKCKVTFFLLMRREETDSNKFHRINTHLIFKLSAPFYFPDPPLAAFVSTFGTDILRNPLLRKLKCARDRRCERGTRARCLFQVQWPPFWEGSGGGTIHNHVRLVGCSNVALEPHNELLKFGI